MANKAFKIISLITTIAGIGVSIAQTIVGDKQRKMDIAAEVKKALENK